MKLIQKIEIRHFRSIFEQNVDELNHLNIFGGQNDSGKSNILRILNLFFNSETSFMEEFNFFDDFSMFSKKKARESKKGRQFISIKIYFDPNEIKGNKSSLIKLAKDNGGLWVERKWWASGTYEQNEPDYIKNASQGVKRSFSVFLQSVKFVYIPAFKSEDVFSYILKLSARNRGLFLSSAAKDELDKNIEKTTTDFSNDFQDITGIETLLTLPISLESFWSSLEVNSQFEGTPNKFTRGNKADYKIKFTSRGEGIKSLFVPVVLGWLARKASNDHWIWGIDEPENALEALRADNLFKKFVEYSRYAQIYLSTHSPSFLFPQEGVDRCSVLIAEQNEPGNTTFKKISDRTKELEEIFGYNYGSFLRLQKDHAQKIKEQDDLQRELTDLKKEKEQPILFVEGLTDKIAIEAAWSVLYPKESIPFILRPKTNAHSVSFVLENAEVFEKERVFGLFDFDDEGFTRWNGLQSHDFKEVSNRSPESCLVRKKKSKNYFALLLPVPNTDVKDQVISPIMGSHFGDRSRLPIELLFYGVVGLEKYFIKQEVPCGGLEIVFHGQTDNLIKAASRIGAVAFDNFKALFLALGQLSK